MFNKIIKLVSFEVTYQIAGEIGYVIRLIYEILPIPIVNGVHKESKYALKALGKLQKYCDILLLPMKVSRFTSTLSWLHSLTPMFAFCIFVSLIYLTVILIFCPYNYILLLCF